MDKTTETLKGYYDAFVNQPLLLAFFSGLADYMNYIVETPALKEIAEGVLKGKDDMYDELDRLENKALQEIETAKKKLLKIIKNNNVDPALLSTKLSTAPGVGGGLLEQMKMFEDGKVSISGFRSSVLETYLFDIAANLARLGYGDAVRQFVVSGEEYGRRYENPESDSGLQLTGNIHGNFVFSETIMLRTKQDARIDRARGFELWGALDALSKLRKAFSGRKRGMTKNEVLNEFMNQNPGRNAAEHQDLWDIALAFDDLGSMDLTEEKMGIAIPKHMLPHPRYLVLDEFKGFAARVHAYLLKEFVIRSAQFNAQLENETKNQKVDFDQGSGILSVRGKDVKFRKFTEQYHTLASVFSKPEDLQKERFFSELAEKIDAVKGYDDKDFHNYFSAIKRRVSADTGIKDLFITTTQSVKINPEYLK